MVSNTCLTHMKRHQIQLRIKTQESRTYFHCGPQHKTSGRKHCGTYRNETCIEPFDRTKIFWSQYVYRYTPNVWPF